MKNLLIILVFSISTIGFSQESENSIFKKEQISDENSTKKPDSDEKVSNKTLKKRAFKRAAELRKALNLTNYKSYQMQISIIKYSKKANKVIQSNASETEKSKSLSNIIYLQNNEIKEFLTVHQFYSYMELNDFKLLLN